jgi:tripartite-type tricarboxylate transporter receptor subunit TctC
MIPATTKAHREAVTMSHMTRRVFTASLLASPAAAWAQQWPTAQVTLVVPFPPGGSVDAISRMLQPGLEKALGATVVVENKPGASGSIATAQVAKAAPDGATWLVVFDTHGVNPALQPLPYDTEKDFEPVLLIGTAPYLVATKPDKPYASLADVVAAAKDKPGTISYGSVGTGSLGHLAMVLLAKKAGITINHVAYRGGGPAVNDAVGGHIDLVVGSVALLTPQVQGGTLRPVVQTGKTRVPALSSVPTVAESGFAGVEASAWWGVFAPKGTPAPLVERMRAALVAYIKEEAISRQLTGSQQITLDLGGPDVLRPFLAEQIKVWGSVVRENNIKAGN